jgi:hypothetical protein
MTQEEEQGVCLILFYVITNAMLLRLGTASVKSQKLNLSFNSDSNKGDRDDERRRSVVLIESIVLKAQNTNAARVRLAAIDKY